VTAADVWRSFFVLADTTAGCYIGQMTNDTSNIVLEHLRHIRAAVDEMKAQINHFIMRVGVIERNAVTLHVSDASQNEEIDRIKVRSDRIERRLELNDS
jgi:hypothetical protein